MAQQNHDNKQMDKEAAKTAVDVIQSLHHPSVSMVLFLLCRRLGRKLRIDDFGMTLLEGHIIVTYGHMVTGDSGSVYRD